MSCPITSGGQSIWASVSASVLPMNIQGWFSLGLTGLISLLSKGLSRVFSSTVVQKHQFFGAQPSLWSNSHIHTWLQEKPYIALTIWIFVGKVMSLLFNTLSRFVIVFLPRSNHFLISRLQSTIHREGICIIWVYVFILKWIILFVTMISLCSFIHSLNNSFSIIAYATSSMLGIWDNRKMQILESVLAMPLPALWPQVSYSTSLSLHFSIWKMRTVMFYASVLSWGLNDFNEIEPTQCLVT